MEIKLYQSSNSYIHQKRWSKNQMREATHAQPIAETDARQLKPRPYSGLLVNIGKIGWLGP